MVTKSSQVLGLTVFRHLNNYKSGLTELSLWIEEYKQFIGPHIMIQADGSMEKIAVDIVTEALNQLVALPTQAETWWAH